MLFTFLLIIYIIACLFLLLFILVQKGKNNVGMGNLGGGTQFLFGGSGGTDFFQKTTWVLGAIFMVGSLGLSMMKVQEVKKTHLFRTTSIPAQNTPQK